MIQNLIQTTLHHWQIAGDAVADLEGSTEPVSDRWQQIGSHWLLLTVRAAAFAGLAAVLVTGL